MVCLRPPRPLIATLFPYTTLFRSDMRVHDAGTRQRQVHVLDAPALGNEHRRADARRAVVGDRCRARARQRSEEHTSELQSHVNLVCRLLVEKKKVTPIYATLVFVA